MAMTSCSECKAPVSTKATACPSCGAPIKKESSLGGCGCLVAIVVGAICIKAVATGSNHEPPSTSGPATSNPTAPREPAVARPEWTPPVPATAGGAPPSEAKLANANAAGSITDEEKKYLSVALGELQTLHNEAMRLGTTIEKGQTGAATLGDIRDAIKLAQQVEQTNVSMYYRPAAVPPGYEDFDKRILDSRRLWDASMEEMLDYWKDSNTAHIESGIASLKRASEMANEATVKLTDKMKSLNAAKAPSAAK